MIGVAAGVISLLLGVLGVAFSLAPPTTRRGKVWVIGIFVALSVVAIVATVADRREANRAARDVKEQMDQLLSSSVKLTEQNQQLLVGNNTLQQQLQRAADAPRQLTMQQTLKHDVQSHLASISAFLAERQNKFRQEALTIPPADYPSRYEYFRRQLASSYASDYYPRTRELLKRAAKLNLIPDEEFGIDGRFIEAGLLPYIDDLQNLVERLPD